MSQHKAESNGLFRGAGEMPERIRQFDWPSTSLGAIHAWPQSLKATVRTMLGSRYPMILLWGHDELAQIYNDAYTGLIGAKHPGALGRSIRATQAESWETIGPMIREVMSTGVPNWVPAQLLAVNRAGYDEEAYFSLSYSAVEDDDGLIQGMLCVCSEVTAQVLAERRLKLQRDLTVNAGEARSTENTCRDIAAVFGNYSRDVPFALVYLIDESGGELRRAAFVGLEPTSSLGDERVVLAQAAGDPLMRAAKGEFLLLEDVQSRCPGVRNGPWNELVHTAVALPVAGASGATLGVLVLGVNPNRALDDAYRSFYQIVAGQVSIAIRNARAYEEERKRADALAELDRAKTHFFSNVSHEFRTPLTLLLGPLEDLLARTDLPVEARGALKVAQRNALRLLRLVNTLLDFSRVEAGRANASYEAVDLAASTAGIASTFRSAFQKAGLALVVDCPPLPERIFVDPEMWEKVISNLVSNAFKHTFEGQVAVTLRDTGDQAVRLTVSDTGVGIPRAEVDRIFDRFHRVEGTRSRTHEGSGIGLALVRELLRLHGASITVASEPGRGTTFTVTIPKGSEHLPSGRIKTAVALKDPAGKTNPFVDEALRWLPEATTPPDSTAAPGTRARIVLADDNADMRNYVERLLAAKHDVVAVADGAAALSALRARQADLLLTDLMMPVMDGFTLLREIRNDPVLKTLPVLLLSARAGEEASVEGIDAGADDYLVKPFSARELMARVDGQIRLLALRREATARAEAIARAEALASERAAILNQLAEGVVVADADGRIVFVNEAAHRLHGVQRLDVTPDAYSAEYHLFTEDGRPHSSQELPLTRAVTKGETVNDARWRIRQPGGAEILAIGTARPMLDDDGTQRGAILTLRDDTARKAAEDALAESEARFRALAENIPTLCWMADETGSIFWYNSRWYAYTGTTPKQMEGWGWQSVHDPVTLPAVLERWKRSLAIGEPFEMVFPLRGADGAYRPFLTRVVPVREDGSQRVRWFGTNTDVAEQQRAQDHLLLMVDELNHRVKNTLAIVQSLAQSTFRRDDVPEDARRMFEARLSALATAHNLLTRERWDSADLKDIVSEVILAHCGSVDRFTVEGPRLRLEPKTAVTLAIALHELCNNAAMYGALSVASGSVSVVWRISEKPEPRLLLRWEEKGGPAVSPPARRGFGSRMVERALASELQGTVRLEFPPGGVCCDIDAAMPGTGKPNLAKPFP